MPSIESIMQAILHNFFGKPIDEKDAYRKGYHALPGAENPYPYGTWDWRKWKRGQEDAERDDRAW
ncbi:hypothetical protein [Paraburkholderia heleia]|uniref:hypothetical protein n=1 Tax=Paraburkholderia heleia TaxID=634127 RepID=UPI000AE95FAD|nr:hypothetical protein [Paraburkholderia heleia]